MIKQLSGKKLLQNKGSKVKFKTDKNTYIN